MRVLRSFGDHSHPITNFNSRAVSSVPLGSGAGEAHVYALHFAPGGEIGRHPTGFGQLLVVVEGRGWVSGADGSRVPVRAGDAVYFTRAEMHAKGSDEGMTALMVQVSDLETNPGAEGA